MSTNSWLIHWEKEFKNWTSKICGRQPLEENLKGNPYRLSSTNFTWSIIEYFVPIKRGISVALTQLIVYSKVLGTGLYLPSVIAIETFHTF